MRKFLSGLALAALAGSASALPGAPLLFTAEVDASYVIYQVGHIYTGVVTVYGQKNDEREEGFAEFDLSGQSLSSSPVYLTFQGAADYSGFPASPAYFNINVDAYAGNNSADISDVFAPSIGAIGSFDTYSNLSDSYRFDVTSLYNSAITANNAAFGVHFRLQNTQFYGKGFTGFALTNSAVIAAVPEPDAAWLLLLGLPFMAWRRGCRMAGRGRDC